MHPNFLILSEFLKKHILIESILSCVFLMENPTKLNSKHSQTYMAYSNKKKNTVPFFKITYIMLLET